MDQRLFRWQMGFGKMRSDPAAIASSEFKSMLGKSWAPARTYRSW
ncbi:hypothetical protein GCM10019059_42720 [Camelimonas fluminis]|nr:hypothetical protein GCM10019059_42720 [Camelimonas fluminis]